MTNSSESFETLKSRILDFVEISDIGLVHNSILNRIDLLRLEADTSSTTVEHDHRHDRNSTWALYHNFNIRYLPGESIVPVRQQDAARYLCVSGYSDEEANVLWDNLIYPGRDTSSRYRDHTKPFEDVYPVGLIHYERVRDGNKRAEVWDNSRQKLVSMPLLTATIDAKSATLDAASLKTYLAWLGDRDQSYGEGLSQHLSPEELVVWNGFITYLEKNMGEVLPINRDEFAYFDSASEYLLFRERGIRKFAGELLKVTYGERRRINAQERATLEYPEPETPLQLCRGIWYFPAKSIHEHPTRIVIVNDFVEAAIKIGASKTTGITAFRYMTEYMAGKSLDFYGANRHLYLGVFNQQNTAWDKANLGVEAEELFYAIEDAECIAENIEGIGKTSKSIIRSVLVASGLMEFDPDLIRYIRKRIDPADAVEINPDDPDLKNYISPHAQPVPDW